jgi:carbamoyl-phosphate synthase large subunit
LIKVAVTGVGGQGGIVVVRTLSSEKGLHVVGMDANPLSAGFKFTKERYIIPMASDPKFVEYMLETASEARFDVLIPTVDEELIALSKNRHKFEEKNVKLAVSDSQTILNTLDKYILCKILYRSGISVPKTILAKEIGLDDLDYPIIIKPRIGRGSRDISICKSAEELRILVHGLDNLIIQDYLQGDEYTIDTLSDMEGKAIVAVPRKRIEIRSGISWKGAVIDDESLTHIALRTVEALKIKGPACVQIKLDAKNVPKVIEVNPRIGGGASLTVKAGVNIPLLTVRLLLGIKPKQAELRFRKLMFARYFEDTYFDSQGASIIN